MWGVRAIYVPLLGSALSIAMAWWSAVAVVALLILSLGFHALGHIVAARLTHSEVPTRVPVYPLGDSSQVWPRGRNEWSEALNAISGPAASLIAAGVAYLVWNAQFNTFVSTVFFFLIFYNLGVAALNAAPLFPFDGARLVRSAIEPGTNGLASRWLLTHRGGLLLIVGWLAWSAFLAAQRLRFSTDTSGTMLVLAALAAVSLGMHRGPQELSTALTNRARWSRVGDFGALVVIVAILVGVSILPLPTNSGMEAPGFAASVEPMVHVPPNKSYPVKGTLILTTVVPQAPIVVVQWIYGRINPAVRLTNPAQIVPVNTTPQQLAIQGFRDLQASEKTAIVMGLQLAGLKASLQYTGAEIVGVENQSAARDILQPGDQITAVNGAPVTNVTDISHLLSTSPQATSTELGILRGGQTTTLKVPVTPASATGTPPRIGILVSPTGDKLELPFPVSITPEKVAGGPSAGLMFTLTVYNAVTPADLTQGRKIAGTGTIDLNGDVGPIGGVEQKVAAAEHAGATYFLCPPDNYADALKVAHHIKVVKIATAQQAIQFLKGLPPPA